MSSAPRIAACLIVKDEIETLARSIASIRSHVDEINVYDTGSTDGTLEMISNLAGAPVRSTEAQIRWQEGEWRHDFSWARRQSFAMASDDIDWLLVVDADDEVVGGEALRAICTTAESDVDGFTLLYEYKHDQEGNVVVQLRQVRIVRKSAGYEWQGPVHEILVPPQGREHRLIAVSPDSVRIVHRPSGLPDPTRNIEILRIQHDRDVAGAKQPDARTLFYLGLEWAWQGEFEAAIEPLRAYLRAAGDSWHDERLVATNKLAACLRATGAVPEAIDVELEAHHHRPEWTETALGLAESYAVRGDWPSAAEWARRAAAMPPPPTDEGQDVLRLKLMPTLRLAEAALQMRRNTHAAEALEVLIETLDEGQLRESVANIAAEIRRGRQAEAAASLRVLVARHDPVHHALVRSLWLRAS
jgi:glycosyltransferase involved in cell wall biosynthesis